MSAQRDLYLAIEQQMPGRARQTASVMTHTSWKTRRPRGKRYALAGTREAYERRRRADTRNNKNPSVNCEAAKAAALHLCRNGPARRGVCSYRAGAHGSWCPLDALAGSALTPQLQPHKRTQKKAKQPW